MRAAFLTTADAIDLPTAEAAPVVSKDAVSRAMDRFANPAMSGAVVITLAGEGVRLEPDDFAPALSMKAVGNELQPQLDAQALLAKLTPKMGQIVEKPADATFKIVGGKPRVVPAKTGVTFDPAGRDRTRSSTLVTKTGAERTLDVESVDRQAGRSPPRRPRRSGSTSRSRRSRRTSPTRSTATSNIGRAAELVDGTVLKPGETFCLNDTVGERTARERLHQGLHHQRRHLQGGPRRRRLADGDDDVQRAVLRRARGRRAQAALVLHRPLPGRPRGDRRVGERSTCGSRTTRRTAC